MFKRIKNKLLTSAMTSVVAFAGYLTFWDLIQSSSSLLLFGEPEYPSED